jgi:cytochrome c oxidase subunit 2
VGTGPPISTYGGEIDSIISFIGWIVFGWFVLAEGLLLYFLFRYRRRQGKRASWLPGNGLRASAWVLVPCFLILIFDLWIEARSASVWHKVVEDVPKPDVLVRVTGRQFAWTFNYAGQDGVFDTDDDFTTVGEMHVPQDKVVRFQLESVDVLHSFWIPAVRYKQDVVPGRSIPGWFQATKSGRYEIACAELCGSGHTSMRALLTVEPPEIFDNWARNHAKQQLLAAEAAKR